MKFSIGYNYDIKCLDLLSRYKKNIEAFYFPIPSQYLGSGRWTKQSDRYIKEIPLIIKKCKNLKIRSQLLLNASCGGAIALESSFFFKIIAYIKKLRILGLDSVVVANPIYIPEIRKQIKDITIESSVNCYVKTVEHALYMKRLGIDVLTIDRDINRNIALIKEIKKRTGLKIRILLNEGCLRNCPFRQQHFNFIAHKGSTANKNTKQAEIIGGNFAEKWCMHILSKTPEVIFSSPFIPPDSLKYYTSFVDFFKLATRTFTTSNIEQMLKAYTSRKFKGNLTSLLACLGMFPFFKYIDYEILQKSNFFKRMLKCTDDCKECNYCRKLIDKAAATNSYFLNTSDPKRVSESKKNIKIYTRLLQENTGSSMIYKNLSEAYLLLKDYKKASMICKKAISELLQKEYFYFELGKIYFKQKRYQDVISILRKLPITKKNSFTSNKSIILYFYKMIILSYRALKQYKNMRKELKKMKDRYPQIKKIIP